MSNKQSQLRQMMKLEREKKSSSTSNNSPLPPKKTKGILKSKSSYVGKNDGGSSSNNEKSSTLFGENVKIEIVKKKRTKNKNSKVVKNLKHQDELSSKTSKGKVAVVDFAAIEKEEEFKSMTSEERNDVEDEFEDFLNSVDDIEVEENDHVTTTMSQGSDEKKESQEVMKVVEQKALTNHSMSNDINVDLDDGSSENTIEDDNSKRQEQEMEMEQTAYEARLAKLMLLSRKRKSKEVDETIVDFTPQLAFQENSTSEVSPNVLKDNPPSIGKSDGKKDAKAKSKTSTSNSMKDLLRKKKKKAKVSANHGDLDDDSFWS